MTGRPVGTLSRAQARRIALVAQGFADRRPATPTMRTLNRTLSRTSVLQVDSVNVLQRAHYMPLFSRMGAYDTELLRRASGGPTRRLVEYWAHVQAFMPVDLWPVMQFRMAHYRDRRGKWSMAVDESVLEASLVAEIRARGACTARDLDDGADRPRGSWGWNWSEARRVLDYLYMSGQLAISGRNSSFEVEYDLLERVLPATVLNAPTPTDEDAHRALIRRAAISHGVATEADLRDYFRMHTNQAGPALRSLVEDGELVPVTVEGWRAPAYLHRDAARPRTVHARALLSPFDPVVWLRKRAEELFDFRYRIEIYVPAAKREFGYYVLPFLLGDRLVGRVDLRADRRSGVLEVKAAYAEPQAPAETAAELAGELCDLAGWLGLSGIVVGPRGDLASRLAAELTNV